jgi:glutaredoxin
MKRLFVFTVIDCVFCAILKQLLLENKISFFDYDVDLHPQEFLKLYEITGHDFVPAVWIKNGEHDVYIVPERDFRDISEAVDKIKEQLKN